MNPVLSWFKKPLPLETLRSRRRKLLMIAGFTFVFHSIAIGLTFFALNFSTKYYELSTITAYLMSIHPILSVLATVGQALLFTLVPYVIYRFVKTGFPWVATLMIFYCGLAAIDASWDIVILTVFGI
jgi:hypothetical protein